MGTPRVLWMYVERHPVNLVSGMGTQLKTEVPYDGRAPEAIPTDGCWDFDLGCRWYSRLSPLSPSSNVLVMLYMYANPPNHLPCSSRRTMYWAISKCMTPPCIQNVPTARGRTVGERLPEF